MLFSRREEISGLIKKLYEAYATGKIPENHFSELLTSYDTEQKALDGEIEKLQAEIERYNTDSVRADKFIELVKRHTGFNEFSASLLNEFVEKIIVHEATKVNGVREQEVEIYLNFIDKFDLPEQEEQRAVLRERDKARYAKKTAAEEAQRAAQTGTRRKGNGLAAGVSMGGCVTAMQYQHGHPSIRRKLVENFCPPMV